MINLTGLSKLGNITILDTFVLNAAAGETHPPFTRRKKIPQNYAEQDPIPSISLTMSSTSDSSAATASAATGGGGTDTVNSSTFWLQNLGNLGLGYAIAFALGFLVLLSTILLAAYVCCRSRARYRADPTSPPPEGVIIPRIIFVAEDDEDEENRRESENTVAGLDQMVINSYPKFPFSKLKNLESGGDSACSICLCDYKEGEMMRVMPDCKHYFHVFCVDAWLKIHASCPVCRNSPLPTPLSTPLSELVPLSQYGDNRRRR